MLEGWGPGYQIPPESIALPWPSVLDYGAVADNGITDNTSAFNTALAAGGRVIVPPGNYGFLGQIVLPPGGQLVGTGSGSPNVIPPIGYRSVLRRFGNTTGTVPSTQGGVTVTGNAVPFIYSALGGGPQYLWDLEVDCRSLAGTAVWFQDNPSGEESHAYLERLYIHDAAINAGAFADGDGIFLGIGRRNMRLTNVYTRTCGRFSSNVWGSDSMWVQCTSDGAGYDGLVIQTGGANTRYLAGESFGAGAAAATNGTLTVTGVTVANPAVISYTGTPTIGPFVGQRVFIQSVTGATAVNGAWTITAVAVGTVTINVNNTNAWVSGGSMTFMAAGLTNLNPNAQSQFVGTSFDRNQMMSVFNDQSAGILTLFGCIMHSDSQVTTGTYPCVYHQGVNSLALIGCQFGPLATGITNKPTQAIQLGQGAPQWIDIGNSFNSTGFSTSSYSSASINQKLRTNNWGGPLNFSPGADARSAMEIYQNSGTQSADLLDFYTSAGSTLGLGHDFAGRPVGKGASVTSAVGSAAGTSPTLTVTGNDTTGTISLTIGTAPPTSGTLLTVTFAGGTWAGAPKVSLQATGNAGAGPNQGQVTANASTTNFILGTGVALTASTTYTWTYTVVG